MDRFRNITIRFAKTRHYLQLVVRVWGNVQYFENYRSFDSWARIYTRSQIWCTFCSKKGLKGPIFGLKDTLWLLYEVLFVKLFRSWIFSNLDTFPRIFWQSYCCGDLKMASYLTDMDEIHRIIFEAPDSSDNSWQSSSEDSIQSSGSE